MADTKFSGITNFSGMIGFPRCKQLAADHNLSSTTATEVTGLGPMTLEAGTYVFTYYLIVQSGATTTGLGFGINFTGTATRQTFTARWTDTSAAASTGVPDDAISAAGGATGGHASRTFSTTAPNMVGAGVATINVDHQIIIEGIIVVTASGDLELWHSSETAVSTTVESGSSLIVVRTA